MHLIRDSSIALSFDMHRRRHDTSGQSGADPVVE